MATSSLCCSICSENYKSTDEILATKCGHVFHTACFQDWQSRSTTCPECREANPQSQRIFLHIEDPTEAERNLIKEKLELVGKVSVLQQQLEENEQNLFDVHNALSAKEEQMNELSQQLDLKNALIASYEQELSQIKLSLEESENNFMSTLEELKKNETLLNNLYQEIDFLKLQNESRLKKLDDLRTEQATSNKQSQDMHLLLQNKLKISQDEIVQLRENMNVLKISSLNQQSEINLNKKNAEYVETIKRLELKLKQMSLELDKEVKLTTNLTVENMKLKSIIDLQDDVNKQQIATECDEQRKNNSIDNGGAAGICDNLIDLCI